MSESLCQGFIRIPNTVLSLVQRGTITPNDMFIYSYGISKPKDWIFHKKTVLNETGFKKDALRKSLSNLRKNGLVVGFFGDIKTPIKFKIQGCETENKRKPTKSASRTEPEKDLNYETFTNF